MHHYCDLQRHLQKSLAMNLGQKDQQADFFRKIFDKFKIVLDPRRFCQSFQVHEPNDERFQRGKETGKERKEIVRFPFSPKKPFCEGIRCRCQTNPDLSLNRRVIVPISLINRIHHK